jgi:hypothetical protein
MVGLVVEEVQTHLLHHLHQPLADPLHNLHLVVRLDMVLQAVRLVDLLDLKVEVVEVPEGQEEMQLQPEVEVQVDQDILQVLLV